MAEDSVSQYRYKKNFLLVFSDNHKIIYLLHTKYQSPNIVVFYRTIDTTKSNINLNVQIVKTKQCLAEYMHMKYYKLAIKLYFKHLLQLEDACLLNEK